MLHRGGAHGSGLISGHNLVNSALLERGCFRLVGVTWLSIWRSSSPLSTSEVTLSPTTVSLSPTLLSSFTRLSKTPICAVCGGRPVARMSSLCLGRRHSTSTAKPFISSTSRNSAVFQSGLSAGMFARSHRVINERCKAERQHTHRHLAHQRREANTNRSTENAFLNTSVSRPPAGSFLPEAFTTSVTQALLRSAASFADSHWMKRTVEYA